MEQISNFFNQIIDFLELHLIHRVETMVLTDFIDIIILATLMFYVFKFILNRRAARLTLGLVITGLVMLLTWIFDMKATTLIFQLFYQAGAIAIIIMFQPELRSALEKIGNAPISNIKNMSNDNKSSSYVANSIAIITKTAVDLANEKTGALIVVERETKLGEYTKTGTFINAQLSSQLLKNIFFNKAPLHDGAVILRNYRLYSAGCFLPLSTKEDIDENMGTRHRAAIGISEVSDAIAVIVSEETGKISIAIDGELIHDLNQKTLRKELSKLLIPNTTSKTKNSQLKLKLKNEEEEAN